MSKIPQEDWNEIVARCEEAGIDNPTTKQAVEVLSEDLILDAEWMSQDLADGIERSEETLRLLRLFI